MELRPLDGISSKPTIAILIKESSSKPSSVLSGYSAYISKELLPMYGVAPLYYAPNNKISVKDAKAYIMELLPMLAVKGITHLYVADSTYFKILTNEKKSDPWRGYILPCAIEGFEFFKIFLGYNYNVLFHNPNYDSYISTSIQSLEQSITNNSTKNKKFNFKLHSVIDMDTREAGYWYDYLINTDKLSIDLEGFDLKFYNTSLATVSIAWNAKEALAFNIDMQEKCIRRSNIAFTFLLKLLFNYKGKWIAHNASFDFKVFIFELFMKRDFHDFSGMNYGIETLCENFEDTKLIYYCATNNAVENKLSLKEIAHEYVGNYAQESIDDVTQIPLKELLKYNAIDAVATFWVYEKYYPKLIEENQLEVYGSIFKKSVKLFLQAELVGVPLCMDSVLKAINTCEAIKKEAQAKILNSPAMKQYAEEKATFNFDNQHLIWKKKRESLDYFRSIFEFNPNSNQQAADFLYNFIGFDPVEFTDGGEPSTSKDALLPLKFQTDDPQFLEILQGFLELSEVSIILNNFLTTFRDESILKEDGVYWLHGSFNIGGTKSGRLSSSNPNLQNIPSSSKYGKLIKSCIKAPTGWIICGADFSSLEDRVDALLTKDTNKLKVYTDGYDGHSLRTYFYFSKRMPDIDPNDVNSINSIKDLYPIYRQDSKAVTFSLTYLGTWSTLVKNCGFTKEQAKEIERSYHILYKESDEYKDKRLEQASIDGYAVLAFGLKIRCKLLQSSMYGSKYMTSAARAEMRTIGNAFGQSYGMLNNRAGIAFQETCLSHPTYSESVFPIMHIHDAQYYLIRDDLQVLHFTNTHVVKEMSWQELPEISHDQVKLGAELEVFHPSWANPIHIPNNATIENLISIGETISD